MGRRFFTFSVVLAVSITLKPIPITAPQKGERLKENQAKSSNYPEAQRQSSTNQSNNTTVTVNPSSSESEEERERAKENTEIQRRIARYTLGLLIVGLCIGLAQLVIVGFQVFWGKRSADTAIIVTQSSERAYVTFLRFTIKQLTPGKPIIVEAGISNTGKTPAILRLLESGITIDKNLPKNPIYGLSQPCLNTEVHPNLAKINVLSFSPNFDSQSHELLKNGENGLWLYCKATYSDVFGNEHTTSTCIKYLGPGEPGFIHDHTENYNKYT